VAEEMMEQAGRTIREGIEMQEGIVESHPVLRLSTRARDSGYL
jgi:hypothetical protein